MTTEQFARTSHVGYFQDSIANQPWYRCLQCPYDTFSHHSIQAHVQYSHELRLLPHDGPNLLAGKHIAMGFLTWSTVEASLFGYEALISEYRRLSDFGAIPGVFWFDNGSYDGTYTRLGALEIDAARSFDYRNFWSSQSAENLGQSRARNNIIKAALDWGADMLLMVDGDVEIVPFSAYALGNALTEAASDVGCVGVYCRNCTHVRDSGVPLASPDIQPWMLDETPRIAWTNYGMFRREVLEKCHFDTNGPFAGPGWGFEDDDFYLQMAVAGYKSLNTKYLRHMHRRRHSSVKVLGSTLAAKVFLERKAYMLDKWRGVAEASDTVRLMENQTFPVLEY